MIVGLQRFVLELRRDGIRASPAEWLDALRALEVSGLEDRRRVHAALSCSLVKRASQRAVFDRVFDRFFAAPARGGARRERRKADSGAGGNSGRAGEASTPARASRSPARRRVDPARRWLERARKSAAARHGRLRLVLTGNDSGERRESVREAHRVDPLRRDLRRVFTAEEEREIASRLPRLVEQLRIRSGRRRRRAARGRLYLRRVFRDNLAQGGVPFVLPRRRVQPRRPKVVLLIDVSWSTARAAGLFLSLAGEFLRRSHATRTLFFVDRAVDGSGEVERWLRRRELSFGELIGKLERLNPGAPSDYGRAFHQLLRSPIRPRGRDTLLLVLGDGRTNRFDPQDWAFEELAEGCGATLWLVPEPVSRWGTGDSALEAYLPHVDVAVETRDLVGLTRGVAELLRRL